MKRIGILGGTFNPPHNGHIHAARSVKQALGLDGILLIPDNLPPHKELPARSATPEQRLDMTRIAAASIPGAQVTDMELTRGGRSYTVDTLRALTAQQPDTAWYFIMGTDMLTSFHHWWQPKEICKLCTLAVIARDEGDWAAITQAADRLTRDMGAHIEIVDVPPLPGSSTQLRADPEACRRFVPPELYRYIVEHGLYF